MGGTQVTWVDIELGCSVSMQRAWLDGEQTLEFEIRAVSPGSTTVFVTGFAGPPYTATNSVIDDAIYELNFFQASVIP